MRTLLNTPQPLSEWSFTANIQIQFLVGSSTFKHTNFRLICATHMNLKDMVKNGSFRQDLFYRINVFPISVPTLRERKEDLAILTAH